MNRVVIESPLSGDFQKNFRFLLWCCRAVWLEQGLYGIASHMLNPWFMDDTKPEERQAGMDNPWVWDPGVPHLFFTDLGMSGGMEIARKRCVANQIFWYNLDLRAYSPACFEAFERGEWPPHTPGFEIAA